MCSSLCSSPARSPAAKDAYSDGGRGGGGSSPLGGGPQPSVPPLRSARRHHHHDGDHHQAMRSARTPRPAFFSGDHHHRAHAVAPEPNDARGDSETKFDQASDHADGRGALAATAGSPLVVRTRPYDDAATSDAQRHGILEPVLAERPRPTGADGDASRGPL